MESKISTNAAKQKLVGTGLLKARKAAGSERIVANPEVSLASENVRF
jgi:hypothetical protein